MLHVQPKSGDDSFGDFWRKERKTHSNDLGLTSDSHIEGALKFQPMAQSLLQLELQRVVPGISQSFLAIEGCIAGIDPVIVRIRHLGNARSTRYRRSDPSAKIWLPNRRSINDTRGNDGVSFTVLPEMDAPVSDIGDGQSQAKRQLLLYREVVLQRVRLIEVIGHSSHGTRATGRRQTARARGQEV